MKMQCTWYEEKLRKTSIGSAENCALQFAEFLLYTRFRPLNEEDIFDCLRICQEHYFQFSNSIFVCIYGLFLVNPLSPFQQKL